MQMLNIILSSTPNHCFHHVRITRVPRSHERSSTTVAFTSAKGGKIEEKYPTTLVQHNLSWEAHGLLVFSIYNVLSKFISHFVHQGSRFHIGRPSTLICHLFQVCPFLGDDIVLEKGRRSRGVCEIHG